MRVFTILTAFLLLFHHFAGAVTVVLKSGRQLSGELISEERSAVTIRSEDGTQFRLSISQIDREATIAANKDLKPADDNEMNVDPEPVQKRPSTLAEAAEQARRNRTGNARVYTEADLIGAPALASLSNNNQQMPVILTVKLPDKSEDLETWIKTKEKEYLRLKSECRSAGADPDARKIFQTDKYIVNGKEVSVSGYWADPEQIQKAKQICRNAMEAEAALTLAREQLRR